ncbi:MAG: alcohol dehydrogenase catalytic domain-containing protein, partial [Devosia sp.]
MIDALVCTQPGELQLVQRPDPEPRPGDALVRVRRVGVCGTDYHIFEGSHPFLQYPRVMGHELAVEVVSAPAESGFKAGDVCVVNPYLSCGDCVACRAGKPNCCVRISVLGVHQDGGMTSLLTLPVKNLVRADGLSVDECATVEFLAIGAHAVRRGAVAAGDRVLVVGAGPIGLGAAIFAKVAGGSVTVMDLDPERLEAARALLGVATIAAGESAAAA